LNIAKNVRLKLKIKSRKYIEELNRNSGGCASRLQSGGSWVEDFVDQIIFPGEEQKNFTQGPLKFLNIIFWPVRIPFFFAGKTTGGRRDQCFDSSFYSSLIFLHFILGSCIESY